MIVCKIILEKEYNLVFPRSGQKSKYVKSINSNFQSNETNSKNRIKLQIQKPYIKYE